MRCRSPCLFERVASLNDSTDRPMGSRSAGKASRAASFTGDQDRRGSSRHRRVERPGNVREVRAGKDRSDHPGSWHTRPPEITYFEVHNYSPLDSDFILGSQRFSRLSPSGSTDPEAFSPWDRGITYRTCDTYGRGGDGGALGSGASPILVQDVPPHLRQGGGGRLSNASAGWDHQR